MSTLDIRDETGAAQRLLVDETGRLNVGSGSPAERFSVLGTAVAKANGLVTNRRAISATVAPTTGSVTLGPQESANINTEPGRRPVLSHTQFGFVILRLDLNPPQQCTTQQPAGFRFNVTLASGSFSVFNANSADPACSTSGLSATMGYAWM